MPIRADILAQLADVLAELYPDHGSIRTMAITAGLSLAHIPSYPRPLDIWVEVLKEAEVQGCTQVILDRAKTEKPAYQPLQLAYQAYGDWVTADRPTALPVHPPKRSRVLRLIPVAVIVFVVLLLMLGLYLERKRRDDINNTQKPISLHGSIITSTYQFVDLNNDPIATPSYEVADKRDSSRYYPAASGVELQIWNNPDQKHILLYKRVMLRLVGYQPTQLAAVRVIVPPGAEGYLRTFSGTLQPESIGQIVEIVEAEPIDKDSAFYNISPGDFEVFAVYIDYTKPGVYTFDVGVEYAAESSKQQEWTERPFTIEVPSKYHEWNMHSNEWSTSSIGHDTPERTPRPETPAATWTPTPTEIPSSTVAMTPVPTNTPTSTPTPTRSIIYSFRAPGAGPAGLVRVKDTVWVSVPSEGRLYYGNLQGKFEDGDWLDLPPNQCHPTNVYSCQGGLAWDGTSLWFAIGKSVYQIDPRSGHISDPFEVDLDAIIGIAWDEQALLMIDGQGNLVRYDRSGTWLPKLAIGAPRGQYTGMAWVEGELWVVDLFGNLYRFDGKFERLDSFDKFDLDICTNAEFPFYLALSWDRNNLWTADFQGAQISACGPLE